MEENTSARIKKELERQRHYAKYNRLSALGYAKREGMEKGMAKGMAAERKKWQGVVAKQAALVAEKDAFVAKITAEKDALIAKLQAQLEAKSRESENEQKTFV